jgi:sigma-E factor negative regulatory protein RseC
MDDPKGRIIAFVRDDDGVRALVDVDAREICPRCAAGRGCGAGIFGGRQRVRQVEARIAPGLDLDEGDTVSIELAPEHILRAAVIVYGLPLCGAAIAAAIAYLAGLGDAGAAALALLGLLAGLLAGRRRLDRQSCLAQFTPVVSGLVSTTSQDP